MMVQKLRQIETVALPDSPVDEEGQPLWYVRVQTLNRQGRDEVITACQQGGAAISDTLYRHAVVGFRLPTEGEPVVFGGAEANAEVYADLDQELDQYIYEAIKAVDPWLRSLVGSRGSEMLGNSGSSPGGPTEDTLPSACGSGTRSSPAS